jgi:hypothetical protein
LFSSFRPRALGDLRVYSDVEEATRREKVLIAGVEVDLT